MSCLIYLRKGLQKIKSKWQGPVETHGGASDDYHYASQDHHRIEIIYVPNIKNHFKSIYFRIKISEAKSEVETEK